MKPNKYIYCIYKKVRMKKKDNFNVGYERYESHRGDNARHEFCFDTCLFI